MRSYKRWIFSSCAILGIAVLNLNNVIYADTVNCEKTQVSIILKRKILPVQLPGGNIDGNGSQLVTSSANTFTIAKPTENQQKHLPKMGTIFNNCSLWGVFLVGLLFLSKIISRSKKYDKEEKGCIYRLLH